MNKFASSSIAIGFAAVALVACGGSDDDSADGTTESFCASIEKITESGVEPDTDFDGAIAALKDLEANSPDDIDDDVETFIDGLETVFNADADEDSDDLDEALAETGPAIDRIQAFADDNCEGLSDNIFG